MDNRPSLIRWAVALRLPDTLSRCRSVATSRRAAPVAGLAAGACRAYAKARYI